MKTYVVAAVLSSVMAAGPAMADNDFRALGKVANLSPMTEGQLAAVEGGQSCSGFLSLANMCLNVVVPTITALNVALVGKANQSVTQITTQDIH
jgi:hypothetical protein